MLGGLLGYQEETVGREEIEGNVSVDHEEDVAIPYFEHFLI